jgi:hypothetical protein
MFQLLVLLQERVLSSFSELRADNVFKIKEDFSNPLSFLD